MKAVVDADSCTACGLCTDICPEVFEMKELAEVKVDPVPSENEGTCREAAESCPMECIGITE